MLHQFSLKLYIYMFIWAWTQEVYFSETPSVTFSYNPRVIWGSKKLYEKLLFNLSRLTVEAKEKKCARNLLFIWECKSIFWPSLLREQNVFGKEDHTFHAWYLSLYLPLFIFIFQSFPYLGSVLTFTCSIPSIPQCQVQRQGLSSTLVSNLLLKLTPATLHWNY